MLADDPLQAMIFDLDGVITHTAELHAAAWKLTMDAFLLHRRLAPFALPQDYLLYVDGRPRYEGVAAFLQSRGIELPWGSPAVAPGDTTVCALGNAKNEHFRVLLREKGVRVETEAVDFVRAARVRGIKTGLATSSKNGRPILNAAHLLELFDVVVDGEDAARDHIRGKPAPDLFLHTAAKLKAAPSRTAVFEDAIVGVAAARSGGFKPVVGVGPLREALMAAGADMVVESWPRLELRSDLALVLHPSPLE